MKHKEKIQWLLELVTELEARDEDNCAITGLVSYSWDEICDKAINY